MKSIFLADRQIEIEKLKNDLPPTILTEEKLETLPVCLQRHFKLSGFLNQPLAMNADIVWKNSYLKMSPNSAWKELRTMQFNSVNPIMRTAYMKLRKIPFTGKDFYKNGEGSMIGKILRYFTIINAKGKEVSQSALITSFCEMMFLSGYAFQEYIHWTEISPNTVEATLTDCGISVKGKYHFNDNGLFSYFETEDRFFSDAKGNYLKKKFKAVIEGYKKNNELYIPETIKVLWCLDNGDFEYFKGTIEKIVYNVDC